MCSSNEQLSWAFNAYYMEQKARNSANTDACDFGSNATTQSPSAPSGCSALLGQAGAAGTGVVTSAPTGTGAVAGAATTSSAASAFRAPALDLQLVAVGLYITLAALAGAGFLLL